MAEENKPRREKRRRMKAEDKAKILRAILLDGKKISDIADEYKVHPNQIFAWRKELFEGAAGIFEPKRSDITEKAQCRKIEALEKSIADKDAVIADIAQENLTLKKNFSGRT
jgi:transposase-like protein